MSVKVGLVGGGYWGPNLARAFSSLRPSALYALCGRSEERLARLAARYPTARAYRAYEELLADDRVDAVALAVPSAAHAPLALQALRAGKHVFVEKPMALSVSEAAEMARAAQAAGKVLMVGHLLKFHPAVAYLREAIDAGHLGEVRCFHSQRLNLGQVRREENALWSLAPHDLSLAHYLLGETPSEVAATGGDFLQPGVEDMAFVSLRFPSGALGHVHVSWLDPLKVRRLTVVGSRRMAVFDDMEPVEKLRIHDKGVDRLPDPEGAPGDERLTLRSGGVSVPTIDPEEPLLRECRHFVECVRDGVRPLTDARDGLEVVSVLEAAQASLKAGGAPTRAAAACL